MPAWRNVTSATRNSWKPWWSLDKLSHNPGLTESQKKVVADLIEQTKQVIAKTPPAQ